MCLTIFTFSFNIVGIMGVLLTSFYIFGKAVNYSSSLRLKIITVLWCVLWAFLSAVELVWLSPLLIRPLICAISIFYIFLLTKLKLSAVISAFLFSYGFSYSLYSITATSVSVAYGILIIENINQYLPGTPHDFNQPIFLLLYSITAILQLLLATLIFRIRRFRNGFPFLFERYAIIMALITSGATLIFVTRSSIASVSEDTYGVFLFIAGILIIGTGIYIWIIRGIKAFQRRRTNERNEDLHQQEIAELTHELQQSENNNEILRSANHSINHKIAAMLRINERILQKGKEYNFPAEFSNELAIATSDIRKLAGEYLNYVSLIKDGKKLPSTNIRMLDEIFELFSDRFSENNIFFKLKVNGSIIHMVDNAISQNKLEVIVGDLLQNALIAITSSDALTRNIMVLLGEMGDYYEFSIHDSGIPFDIDTLVCLGAKRVTTYADSGGSGVGFMQIFKTMHEYKASLIIQENRKGSAFSKSITIRFDGKSQYVIKTYRVDGFPKSEKYTLISSGDKSL